MSVIDEITRKVIEDGYEGLCDIYVQQAVKDPVTKQTSRAAVKQNKNPIACGLSYKNTSTTSEGDGADKQVQQIELFLAPEVSVPTGSKIIVTQNGVTQEFMQSGVPAVYATHQEIVLEIFKRWA